MRIKISKVSSDQIETLQNISIKTFTDTYGKQNTEKDLKDYFIKNYGLSKLNSEVQSDQSAYFFIYFGKQIAGYIKLNIGNNQTENISKESLEVQRIYIRKAFQRQGLGKQLINFAINYAKESNKKNIWLGVWEQNASAISFYHAMGFKQVGSHHFILGSQNQTDLIMEKPLAS